MLWLKSCPRCDTGDLYQKTDIYGRYVSCLQCGYYLTEAEEVVFRYSLAEGRENGHQDVSLFDPVVVAVTSSSSKSL